MLLKLCRVDVNYAQSFHNNKDEVLHDNPGSG